jgi:hypothetical protein
VQHACSNKYFVLFRSFHCFKNHFLWINWMLQVLQRQMFIVTPGRWRIRHQIASHLSCLCLARATVHLVPLAGGTLSQVSNALWIQIDFPVMETFSWRHTVALKRIRKILEIWWLPKQRRWGDLKVLYLLQHGVIERDFFLPIICRNYWIVSEYNKQLSVY